MNTPTKLAGLCLGCGLAALLAACGSSSSATTTTAVPTTNGSLSQPNLEATMEPGDISNFYAFFNNTPTSEYLAVGGDLDNMPISSTINPNTGEFTLSPPASIMPGIYSLDIDAANAGGITSQVFIANVLPTGNIGASPTPTFVSFVPDPTQSSTPVSFTPTDVCTTPNSNSITGNVTFPVRNGINNVSFNQDVQLLAPAGTCGITVNTVTVTSTPTTGNPDAGVVSVNITVWPSLLSTYSETGAPLGKGILMTLSAQPPANGFTLTPYMEMVYVDNLN